MELPRSLETIQELATARSHNQQEAGGKRGRTFLSSRAHLERKLDLYQPFAVGELEPQRQPRDGLSRREGSRELRWLLLQPAATLLLVLFIGGTGRKFDDQLARERQTAGICTASKRHKKTGMQGRVFAPKLCSAPFTTAQDLSPFQGVRSRCKAVLYLVDSLQPSL